MMASSGTEGDGEPIAYLLIHRKGIVRRTRCLLESHFTRADKGALRIINMETEEAYFRGRWASIPARSHEPGVLFVLEAD